MKKLVYVIFAVTVVAFSGFLAQDAHADGLKLTGWSYEVDTVNGYRCQIPFMRELRPKGEGLSYARNVIGGTTPGGRRSLHSGAP